MSKRLLAVLILVVALGIALGILLPLRAISGRGSFLLPRDTAGLDLVWAPDGTALLVLYQTKGGKNGMEWRTMPSGRVRWRAERLPHTLFPRESPTVAFSPQGDRLAVGEKDGVRLFDPATGDEVGRWTVDGYPLDLLSLPDGNVACLVYREDKLYLEKRDWKGELLLREEIAPYDLSGSRAVLSPDGRFLLYTGGKADWWSGFYVVNLRDLETGTEKSWNLKELIPGMGRWGALTGVALRPDGEEIALALALNELGHPFLFLLEVKTGTLTPIPPPQTLPDPLHEGRPWRSHFAYSPNGRSLALSVGGKGIYLVEDMRTRTLWDSYVADMAFSPDGRRLAAVGGRRLVIFDVKE